jgi:hypothetical protein
MRRPIALGLVLVLVAAACSTDDSGATDAGGATPASSAAPDAGAETSPPTGQTDPTAAAADGWVTTVIGDGTKPSLALDRDGRPAIAFLFEDIPEGFVAYADSSDGWAVDLLVEGYFYGPIGLDFGPDNQPNIAYHDHQADSFDQTLGDLTHAVRGTDGWTIEAATSEGHDGWDSTIRVGDDGIVRAAGVDPAQFGRVEGVEYYELVDGVWRVEEIGSGPTEYEWNVDLQVAPDGTVGLTYFATDTQDLIFARRSAAGDWGLEPVATDGDVGRFSSFAFDEAGSVHISYWNADTSEVVYATNVSGSWEHTPVAELGGVRIGFEGARRITSLDLDPDGNPVVAYADTSGVWLARPGTDGTWASGPVATAGDRPLGQLVSMEVDDAGTPHVAFFEVTGNGPLSGRIVYATTE